MKNNHVERKDAGWSISTLLSCARSTAIQQKYDFYEAITTGWNKSRGTWLHAMMESDTTSPDDVVKEQRLEKHFIVSGVKVRITGKPDYTATKRGVLIDYKSKHNLPTKPDPMHEAQFNGYVWLWDGGRYASPPFTEVNVKINSGGMFYITWNTKAGTQFKKMSYPIWDKEQMDEFLTERLTPLIEWQKTGNLPRCNSYIRFPGRAWKCDCDKLQDQLEELGTWNE
jgi:hypothetical protein